MRHGAVSQSLIYPALHAAPVAGNCRKRVNLPGRRVAKADRQSRRRVAAGGILNATPLFSFPKTENTALT
jgi:hypothetical protein